MSWLNLVTEYKGGQVDRSLAYSILGDVDNLLELYNTPSEHCAPVHIKLQP